MCNFQHLQTTKHKFFTLCDFIFPLTLFFSFILLQFKGSWWFILLHNEGFYNFFPFTMMVLGRFYKKNYVMVTCEVFFSFLVFFLLHLFLFYLFFPSLFTFFVFLFHNFLNFFFLFFFVKCVSTMGLNILFYFSFTMVFMLQFQELVISMVLLYFSLIMLSKLFESKSV
jgi:hypothetical protein